MFFHNHAILIEIGMLLETLKLFNQRIKNNLKLNPYSMSIISFVISFMIGALASFLNGPNEINWYNYEKNGNSTLLTKQTILFLGPNDFTRTKIGSIYYIAHTFIVHVPLTSIQIISYLTLIFIMKKHFTDSTLQNQSQSRRQRKIDRLNIRTSIMALILCSLSLISRTVLLIALVSLNIRPDFFGDFVLSISDLIIFFNASVLFFVCFNFNHIFRRHLLGVVGLRLSFSTVSDSHSNNKH